jgi:hypothetical protein
MVIAQTLISFFMRKRFRVEKRVKAENETCGGDERIAQAHESQSLLPEALNENVALAGLLTYITCLHLPTPTDRDSGLKNKTSLNDAYSCGNSFRFSRDSLLICSALPC